MPIATLLFAAAMLETNILPPASDQIAIFTAAGFVRRGGDWRTKDCEGLEGKSYSPGNLDSYGDLNGDGRFEVVISESSAICYGMAGSRFWILSKGTNGRWTVVASEIGLPEFLEGKGPAGWPDLQIGGPGSCLPIWRWSGRAYSLHKRCPREVN